MKCCTHSNVLPSCHSNTVHGYYSIQQMEADYKLLLVKNVCPLGKYFRHEACQVSLLKHV